MKRVLLLLLVVGVVMAVTPRPSDAAITDLGEVCFSLVGTPDTIRASIQSSANIASINFRWRSIQPGLAYEIVGAGSATASAVQPGNSIVAISGKSPNTGALSGNHTCSLVAVVSPPSFAGSYTLNCSGGVAPINATGTLAVVTCTAAM